MDVKEKCAEAALPWIESGMTIGLGGGSTIQHLINRIHANQLDVTIVTPSFVTRRACLEKGLRVVETGDVSLIDLAFDGCDQVDARHHALKIGGGIHTEEKLIATMAKRYVLLVDDSKFVERLTFDHPVVLEVLPQAFTYVSEKVQELPWVESLQVRQSLNSDGALVTVNGNRLLDVIVHPSKDSIEVQHQLSQVRGVVDTSLFTDVVTHIIVASNQDIVVYSTETGEVE